MASIWPRALARHAVVSLAATITVTTTTDENNTNPGACSLREAITAANTNAAFGGCVTGMAGLDNIVFNLGAGTPSIAVTGSALPAITEAVNLNGATGGATRIELNGAGAGASANGLTLNTNGSTLSALVINRFGNDGIQITGAGNTVQNSYIGTDAAGTADLGNGGLGVIISDGPNNTIGGTSVGASNLISGNNSYGVAIQGAGASGNLVQGNFIGTDVTGTADLGNGGDGVDILSAPNNTIGGTSAGARNVISGNDSNGVYLTGPGATGNLVQGNFIGTDVTGTADLGNSFVGVFVLDAPSNTVGGTSAGARNIVSGNGGSGVAIAGSPASGNLVQGNFIGTDATGTADLGNTGDGVLVLEAPGNTIGGATAGARNLISGNDRSGVFILDEAASGNQVLGNYIGTDVNGAADVGNSFYGVLIERAPSNTIGGTTAGAGNLIAGNNIDGVAITSVAATGNRVLGNTIFNNTNLGINLNVSSGVTANDTLDPDTGPNNLQNYPVLSCAQASGGTTFVLGSLNSLPATSFRIEFFANQACDAGGFGEGQTFLGYQNVTTDAGGNALISVTLTGTAGTGSFITTTATRLDAMNNPIETSEFSACQTVTAPTVTINDVSLAEGNAGTTNFNFTITLNNAVGGCQPITVNYATQNGTATGPDDFTPTASFVTFNPPFASNTLTQTITVPVSGDTNVEANETFFVNIAAVNATVTDAQGQGTILNDDAQAPVLAVSLADPFGCTGPGDVLNVTALVTNPNATAQTLSFTATLPATLPAVPGSCATNVPGLTCAIAPNQLSVAVVGTLAANQIANITYQVQVGDAASSTQLCINSMASFATSLPATVQACATVNCPPVGPGQLYPAGAEVSDQKAGSVLVYNYYTSDVSSPATNTRISITNTHPTLPIAVHLFFVDGATCSVADAFLCLTQNQTVSVLASDYDPGTSGYVVAVASDLVTGCPVNFNFLIGDEFVKAGAFQANLGAEAIAAIAGGLPACTDASNTATLTFDGVSYNRLPRVLAADNVASNADGNQTQLVINRIGGDLATGASRLGTLFGVLYDDIETPYSFQLPSGLCQLRGTISGTFPRTVPRVDQIIPAGRSGWLKLYDNAGGAILGAQLVANANAAASPNAFNGGHNLHKLTLAPTASLTIPIFAPNCRF